LIKRKNLSASENEIFSGFMAGFLHDIWKEIIYRQHPGLLEKATPFTDEEWEIIRTHTLSAMKSSNNPA